MRRLMRGLAAVAMALLFAVPMWALAAIPEPGPATQAADSVVPKVADTKIDPDTRDRWRHWAAGGGDESRLSTENVGRIWTDKTVRKAPDGSESDFETTLSAMSSTSDTTSLVGKPPDIVLVLDASGSMDDPMDSGDATKRIAALQKAANGFIDSIAEQNKGIEDTAKQHQVAIVKFAGEKRNRVGNETYESEYEGRRFTYNYSQRMADLTVCDTTGASSLKGQIDAIRPAGCTRTDYGLELAEGISSGRADAQKVVVLFTDGSPTSGSNFEADVANNAVTAAKKLKDAGAIVYTIGIFDGANPDADPKSGRTNDTNRFMHAASSNYPSATGYSARSLGARAQDSDYYKSATDSDELDKVFEGISQAITSGSGYPTEIKDGHDAHKSGYITFTDELGDFMQVDGFTAAEIDRKKFGAAIKTSSGNTDTYEFSGEAKNLVITVERAGEGNPQQGDKVTVKIPASLIPLREYKVDTAAGTFAVEDIGNVSPVRVTYTSSVKDAARLNLFTPDKVPGLPEYIDRHWDRDADTVYFLANQWNGGQMGDTVAEFEPADSNSYYYFQKNTPIYTDEACKQRAMNRPEGGKTYYYKDEFIAQGAGGKPEASFAIVAFDGSEAASFKGALESDSDGWFFAKGTARLAYIDQLHTEKDGLGDGNATGTARDVLNPQWNNDNATKNATHIQSHLGNNGKIFLSLAKTPAVLDTKASFGLTKVLKGRDWTDGEDGDHFTFNIKLTSGDRDGTDRRQGSTTVTKADLDENGHAVIDFGSIAFNKVGTYVYKITEAEEGSDAGMTFSKNIATVTIEVTIDAAGVLHATVRSIENPTFTNTYTAETPEDAPLVIRANKTLAGRTMTDGEFTFKLAYAGEDDAIDTAENKGGRVEFAPIKFTTAAKAKDGLVSLPKLVDEGRATLGTTADGKRVWTVKYNASEDAGHLPKGVSATLGLLEITVTVVDNGEGTLTATPDFGQIGNTFKNEYQTDVEKVELRGRKELKAAGGLRKPDITGKFTFTVTGEDGAPMPERASVTNDANAEIDFGQIVFTLDDLNKALERSGEKGRSHTFAYTITEDGAVPGVTNDAQNKRTVKFVVSDDGEGNLEVKQDPEGTHAFTFTNTHSVTPLDSSVTDQIAVTKTLTGRAMRADEFEFELVEGKGESAKVVATGTNDAAGNVTMSKIAYTKPGKHTYTLREKKGGATSLGVTYDDTAYTVETTVTDNGDGTLKAEHAIRGANDSKSASFANSYQVDPLDTKLDLGLTKVLKGRDWTDDDRFDFEISAAKDSPENTPLPDPARVSVTKHNVTDGAAAIEFGTIRYTAAETYKYEIREVAGSAGGITYSGNVATATVVVTENGQGKLTAAEPTVANSVFTNVYTSSLDYVAAGGIKLSKTLFGRPMGDGQFSFTVKPADKASATALGFNADGNTFTAPAAGDGETVTADILAGREVKFTQADAGKTYTFTVVENADDAPGYTYDTAVRTVTIAVADDGAGKITATTTVAGGPEATPTATYATGEPTNERVVIPFKNSYRAETGAAGAAKIVASKELTGRALVDGEFAFHLTYAGTQAPLVSARNNAAGVVDFGSLSYDTDILAELVRSGHAALGATSDGKRQWTIKYVAYEETAGLPAGVSAGTASFAVNVTVVDNGDGTLTAKPSITGDGVFRNVYSTGDPVKMQLNGVKGLSTPAGLTPASIAGKFTFTVTGEPGAPMPSNGSTATNNENGDIDFGELTFTLEDLNRALDATETPVTQDATAEEAERPATRDSTDAADAVDATVADATVADATAATEKLDAADATAVTEGPDAVEAGAAATTTDDAVGDSVAANAAATDGPSVEASPDASSEINAAAPKIETASVAPDAAQSKASTATKPKVRTHTFTYTVSESGSVAGVTNDSVPSRTVKFTVTDDGEGHLTVVRDPAEGPAFTFINTYGVTPVDSSVTDQIEATKALSGRAMRAGEFSFELVEGSTVVATGTNDAAGKIALTPIHYTEPGVHTYTLREVCPDVTGIFKGVTYDAKTYGVTTVVTDNGDGSLKVTHALANADAAVFSNTYRARGTKVKLGAVKVLEGRKLAKDEFSFKLAGDDGTVRTAKNDAHGAIDFGEFSYDAPGTYVYTVSEQAGHEHGMTYDACAYTVTVAIVDDGEGELRASVGYAKDGEPVNGIMFHNVYEKPKEPGEPARTMDSGKRPTVTTTVVRAIRRALPATGDQTEGILAIAAAIAVAGIGMLIWGGRRR